ncbi:MULTISPECIES: ABC transporter substrate-binding protein [unclassified Modicisalibacter]|uniref:MlaC/ttg2D family ABC transporter substrate-binding protein n=1 Tax=unclassified Modicisalibacter TaxID=2679913 RepID=UPI001CCA4025|nr:MULTISPECIES: ABC transporter substrate-binding protein [unclassified Modicisalibacter]MBZ9557183.1 ABC transporter substrate-binding protein [Modicisalibacter sp. R2A 31.J]MBZ9574103.1 ABC transporter substrate-binding protein [Modicisalibacter sp. MOD 31.J]
MMTVKRFSGMGRFLAMSLLLLSLLASGVTLAAQTPQQSPEQLIRNSVNELMGKIEGRKDYYAQHPGELESLVDNSLKDIADFHYIAASVMGRYFRAATPAQRSRFADTFRQTLIDTYAKGLVTFDYRDLRVLDGSGGRYDDQASVDMEVVAEDGKVYPVSYTLRLDDGQWKVVNVIVNGINLGLTFRNQFDQAMRDNNRDYDAVIDGWSPNVGTEELEKGSQG